MEGGLKYVRCQEKESLREWVLSHDMNVLFLDQ